MIFSITNKIEANYLNVLCNHIGTTILSPS